VIRVAEYKWYPVYTNPRAEKKAYDLLMALGIEVYLPLQKTLKQWSDRKKWVEEPLIKSYLFVRITTSQIADVLMTKGISRFIYFSGRMADMPERQINDLKLLLASGAEFECCERSFKKGQRVEIIAGTLKGLRGEMIEVASQKRLLIRIGETGQSLLVQVPAGHLELINL